MRPARAWITLVVVVGLLVVGVGLVWNQYNEVTTSKTTSGTVQKTSMESTYHHSLLRGRLYRFEITYSYSVDGHQYTGHNVYPGVRGSIGGQRAHALDQRFSNGTSVTVHYDPSKPGHAYLLGQYSFFPGFVAILVGLLLCADLFTPSNRWVHWVLDRVDIATGGRGTSRSDGGVGGGGGGEWDDPDALDWDGGSEESGGSGVEEGNRTDADLAPTNTASDDGTPIPTVSGPMTWVVWVAFGLVGLAVVGVYFLLSARPHSLFAYGSVVVVLGAGLFQAGRRLR